jgi:hypothetical protein
MTLAGPLIFYNKFLLDYIYDFDNTYKIIFKEKIIFTKMILETSHVYWYNRYEKELFSNSDSLLVFDYQKNFLDTFYLLIIASN